MVFGTEGLLRYALPRFGLASSALLHYFALSVLKFNPLVSTLPLPSWYYCFLTLINSTAFVFYLQVSGKMAEPPAKMQKLIRQVPIVFHQPGAGNPDFLLNVFEQEFQVHSEVLRM